MAIHVLQDQDSFLSSLPEISLKEGYKQDSYICWSIKNMLDKGKKLYAVCPLSKAWQTPASVSQSTEYTARGFIFKLTCQILDTSSSIKTSSILNIQFFRVVQVFNYSKFFSFEQPILCENLIQLFYFLPKSSGEVFT